MAVDTGSLSAWLDTVGAAVRDRTTASKYRLQYGDLTAVIEVAHNRAAATQTVGYAVWEPRFYELLFGESPTVASCAGAPLVAYGGLLRPPFKALTWPLHDKSDAARRVFAESIVADAKAFFPKLTSLAELLCELTSSEPQFKYADPRSKHRRALHAAVVARRLGQEWKPLVDFARTSPIEQSIGWIDGIAKRLEEYRPTRS